MNFSRRGERNLSLRLEKIRSFYNNQKNVYDIGCDHGHLGLSFLHHDQVERINFIDPSPDVIRDLKQFIDSYITNRAKIMIQQKMGQEIEVHQKNNSIFIAGMGGKEVGEIITHLLPQLDSSSEFVISPHRKILELRALLGTLAIHLKEEVLLSENNQYYQILVLRPGEGEKVSPYGIHFWNTPLGKEYLEHQKRYFSLHRDKASEKYLSFLLSL